MPGFHSRRPTSRVETMFKAEGDLDEAAIRARLRQLGAPDNTLESLLCPICQDPLHRPVTIDDCGHLFCRRCVDSLPPLPCGCCFSCPLCRNQFKMMNNKFSSKTSHPDIFRYLPELDSTHGSCTTCSWKGTKGAFKNHLCPNFHQRRTHCGGAAMGPEGLDDDSGYARYADHSFYYGGFKSDKRHGWGTLIVPVPDLGVPSTTNKLSSAEEVANFHYTGDFFQDRFHGKGTLKYPDGTVYQGSFFVGKKQCLDAILMDDKGNILFKGQFSDDQPVITASPTKFVGGGKNNTGTTTTTTVGGASDTTHPATNSNINNNTLPREALLDHALDEYFQEEGHPSSTTSKGQQQALERIKSSSLNEGDTSPFSGSSGGGATPASSTSSSSGAAEDSSLALGRRNVAAFLFSFNIGSDADEEDEEEEESEEGEDEEDE